MKKLFFMLLVMLIFTNSTNAQDNTGDLLKLHIGVLNKIKLTYEHPLSSTFSLGGSAAYYYGSIPGIKLEPLVRYYIGGEAPSGLYLQAKYIFGLFNPELIYWRGGIENDFDAITKKEGVTSMGGGLDLGYQWLSGRKKNIVIDFSLGVQVMQDINGTVIENNREYTSLNVGFLTTGPGAIFNPKLSIGYKF